MDELIRIDYDHENPTVSGRELHAKLEVATQYKDWFPRMCEYGFQEGKDFNPLKIEQVQIEGTREVARVVTDHMLSIPMAKELCMIQRSEMGEKFRRYFISVEEAWNSPDKVMERALQIAHRPWRSVSVTSAPDAVFRALPLRFPRPVPWGEGVSNLCDPPAQDRPALSRERPRN